VGCVRTGVVPIPNNSTINALVNNGAVVCPATTGNIGVSVSGMHPPFTYSWSNTATTASLTGVAVGFYNVTVTDAVGCKVSKSVSLNQVSPVFVGVNATPVNCIFSANGSATANATGGTGPYTYNWVPGNLSGSTISGLVKGQYYVTATDASGCKGYATAIVGNSATSSTCYCTITGTVFADTNADCVKNSGETGLQNIQVHCSGMGYAYTNVNGIYNFQVPTGNYTITESVLLTYPLAPCQSNNQVVSVTTGASNCQSIVNFANTVTAISDLRIITSNLNLPIPGNAYNQKVIIHNDGTQNENTIKFSYVNDGQLPFSNCAPWSLTQPNSTSFPNWYAINSGLSLNPGHFTQAVMHYNVPTNIPLSTNVVFYDTVAKTSPVNTQWLNDNSPWNNLNNHNVTVVGSYDPNFKEVSPQGKGATGDITVKDSILTYIVHFQNEGTYFAQNIVVIDSLDSDLNIKSMRPGYSDHNFTTEISETGVVRFIFNNINLPWKSGYGDALSSGMFTYSIKLKKGLALGTQIKNKAAIYFDYNEPVITNITLNTLTAPSNTTSIEEMKGAGADKVLLFPNPASNYFTVLVNVDEHVSGLLNIYDISGRQVSSKVVELVPGENHVLENTAHLQNGLYFVQLKTDNIQTTERLIITR
jgi:uncharacterized repeat protein (TIGR01451 family)